MGDKERMTSLSLNEVKDWIPVSTAMAILSKAPGTASIKEDSTNVFSTVPAITTAVVPKVPVDVTGYTTSTWKANRRKGLEQYFSKVPADVTGTNFSKPYTAGAVSNEVPADSGAASTKVSQEASTNTAEVVTNEIPAAGA